MILILGVLDFILIITCIIIIIKKKKNLRIMASIVLALLIICNILMGMNIYDHIRTSKEMSEQIKYNSERDLK